MSARTTPSGGRTLVARLDSDGDVLLAGPAVRAVARGSDHVTLLVSPSGEQAATLLPGVDEVLVWSCPWSGFEPPPVDADDVQRLVESLRDRRIDQAVVMTSYHQSALPLALLLRLAGVGTVVASSEDYPGSLLDVRHPPGGPHEVQRGLSLVAAAGFTSTDDGRLALRRPLPAAPPELHSWAEPLDGFVAVHATASVPARAPSPEHVARLVTALRRAGHAVVLSGTAADQPVTRRVAELSQRGLASGGLPGPTGGTRHTEKRKRTTKPAPLLDLAGRTSFAQLAAVLERATCLVSGNTGPAHLAAAVGTPVVSLFAPVVSAEAWRPWAVPSIVLGDQGAPCAGSRARVCPVPGHPCLDGIAPDDVVSAVDELLVHAPSPERARLDLVEGVSA
ncbi:MAG TPA: glycosyltransferase family 9 protein [Actinomycetales bacterium]|nr:glycosyltransferase family 9 protein [Actinomycetales bacterium]